ncbi:hypothetical protein Mapa_015621 [Marchantia paleacea]|nr:hypothetical protein Mapa_015621 [Marchantia paleacea]
MDPLRELEEDIPGWRRVLLLNESCGAYHREPNIIYKEDVESSLQPIGSPFSLSELRTGDEFAAVALAFEMKSRTPIEIPAAYHPGDQVVDMTDMISKIAEYFPGEDHRSNQPTKSEIAVTALYYEVLSGKLPTKCSITYHCFGFSKVHHLDQQALVDLYNGLICELKCKRRQFLGAFEAGLLYDLIGSRFSTQLAASSVRSCYEEWFLPRKWLFDSLKPLSPVPAYSPSKHAVKGWPTWNLAVCYGSHNTKTRAQMHSLLLEYLTDDEQRDLKFTNMTENKVAVVSLFYEALTDSYSEESPAFTRFGFSEIHSELKRDYLFCFYQAMIICIGCKVQEFLEAYEGGKILHLIEAKHLTLPEYDRGIYYKRLFPEYRGLFNGLKPGPLSVAKPLKIEDKLKPLDTLWDEEEHEVDHFPNGPMTENKLAVADLYKHVLDDFLPSLDSISYKCFGFDKLDRTGEIHLLGLYQGLQLLGCKKQTFLEAYESGKLSDLIESMFSELPEDSRGGYYKWFLQNRALIDRVKPPSTQDGKPLRRGKLCRVCNKNSSSRCARCKKVWYCSREHQTGDWKEHRKSCSK